MAASDLTYTPADDTSPLWRYGIVETYAPAFDDYIRQDERVTIKPNVSIKLLEDKLSEEYKTKVRLFVPPSQR